MDPAWLRERANALFASTISTTYEGDGRSMTAFRVRPAWTSRVSLLAPAPGRGVESSVIVSH